MLINLKLKSHIIYFGPIKEFLTNICLTHDKKSHDHLHKISGRLTISIERIVLM